jgi:hypothetical protein
MGDSVSAEISVVGALFDEPDAVDAEDEFISWSWVGRLSGTSRLRIPIQRVG